MRTKARLWAALRAVYSVDELQTRGLSLGSPHGDLLELFMTSGRGLVHEDPRPEGGAGTLFDQWTEAERLVWCLRELGMDQGEALAMHVGHAWPDATPEHAAKRAAMYGKQRDLLREVVTAAVGSFNLTQLGLD